MKSDKPFRKSLACGSVLFAITAVLLVCTGMPNLSYRLGYVFGPCILAITVTGTWGYFSKKAWSWIRFSITVFILYVVLVFLGAAGRLHKESKTPNPAMQRTAPRSDA
jgi:hypothetical protein